MKKLLSMFAAVALVGAAVPGHAADAAADAKKAGDKAVVAGENAGRSMDHSRITYGKGDTQEVKHADEAIGELQQADPGLKRLFHSAAGYAVFATVGKGGLGVGGAHGTGVLYEQGTAIGKTSLTQVTIGFQAGGQAYTEVIFFETQKALSSFEKGNFEMAAQVSAVAATAGASANAKYVKGVSVFTLAKGGAMAEASVGGQKFGYSGFPKVVSTTSR